MDWRPPCILRARKALVLESRRFREVRRLRRPWPSRRAWRSAIAASRGSKIAPATRRATAAAMATAAGMAASAVRTAADVAAAIEALDGHIILCGLDGLAYRTLEVLCRLGEEVVVIARAPDEGFADDARDLGAIL